MFGERCPPCRAEIPSFVRLQETYGEQGFQVIGLNYERKETEEENLQGVLDFAEEFSINYPCLLSDQETMAQVPLPRVSNDTVHRPNGESAYEGSWAA
ncbi:MAG: TlpA disulfide reductase family protein [Pirellulaceae bacterium]